MEESLIANKHLQEIFELPDNDIRNYSPLVLAYLGDAVFELIVRTVMVSCGFRPVGSISRDVSEIVNASAQSEMMRVVEPMLDENELAVYKRGRNARSATMAKNASVIDYRRATGLEAVMGYLYLKGDMCRMIDLVHTGMKSAGRI